MLEEFGLTALADRYAGDLSGGQRRLVEIMRSLMAEPEVLLLDEPMAGVHPRLAHQIGERLVGLCERGMTIVMVEHELAIMDEFCDPVVVMAEGQASSPRARWHVAGDGGSRGGLPCRLTSQQRPRATSRRCRGLRCAPSR